MSVRDHHRAFGSSHRWHPRPGTRRRSVLVGARTEVRGDVVVHDHRGAGGKHAAHTRAVARVIGDATSTEVQSRTTAVRSAERAGQRLHPRPAAECITTAVALGSWSSSAASTSPDALEQLRAEKCGGRRTGRERHGGGLTALSPVVPWFDQRRVQRGCVAAEQIASQRRRRQCHGGNRLAGQRLRPGDLLHADVERGVVDVRLDTADVHRNAPPWWWRW